VRRGRTLVKRRDEEKEGGKKERLWRKAVHPSKKTPARKPGKNEKYSLLVKERSEKQFVYIRKKKKNLS